MNHFDNPDDTADTLASEFRKVVHVHPTRDGHIYIKEAGRVSKYDLTTILSWNQILPIVNVLCA